MTVLGPPPGGELPPPSALAAGLALLAVAMVVGLEGAAAVLVYREVWQQVCGLAALALGWWLALQGVRVLRRGDSGEAG